jgi:hypothetical protein
MSRYFNRNANRFDNYRAIQARFDSTGQCGHPIKKGETIGWHKLHGAQCSTCWARWSAENREAEIYEQQNGCTFDGEASYSNW